MNHFAAKLFCYLLFCSLQLVRALVPNINVADQTEFVNQAVMMASDGKSFENFFCLPMDAYPNIAKCMSAQYFVPMSCRDIMKSVSLSIADAIDNLSAKFCTQTPLLITVDNNGITWPFVPGPGTNVFSQGLKNPFMLQRFCVDGVATCDGITPTATTSTTTSTTSTTTTTTTTTTLVPGHATSLAVCQLFNNIAQYATPNISQICITSNQAVMLNYVNPFGPILTDIFSKAIAKVCVNNAIGYVDLLDFYKKEICTKVVCTVANC